MKHGLAAATVASIHQVLARHSEVESAILYGSRAKGNFKAGSDIDLTLLGDKLNSIVLGRIDEELDDLLLPYEFDLSIFNRITHADLLDHIRRVGVPFYEKPQAAPKG